MSAADAVLFDSTGEALKGPFGVELMGRDGIWAGPAECASFDSPTKAYIHGLAQGAAENAILLIARRPTGQDYVWCRIDAGARSRFYTDWRPWCPYEPGAQDVA